MVTVTAVKEKAGLFANLAISVNSAYFSNLPLIAARPDANRENNVFLQNLYFSIDI